MRNKKLVVCLLLTAYCFLLTSWATAAVVTTRKINRGEVIKEADVKVVEKDTSKYPSSLILEPNRVVGKETTVFLPKGTVLLGWMLREIPLVRKGAKVEIRANVGEIFVRAKGEALGDGYADRKIKVRNLDSRKIIEAHVLNSEEVEVKIY